MPYRNAVSVLPDPVGAWISTWPPEAIAGHPCSCGGVGASNVRSNHARVAGEKTLSGSIRTSVPLRAPPKCDETVLFARAALLFEDEVEHERDAGDDKHDRADDDHDGGKRERGRAVA